VDGHADIGAYEHQTDDDEIFYNGMEPDTQAPVPPLIEWADRFGDSPR